MLASLELVCGANLTPFAPCCQLVCAANLVGGLEPAAPAAHGLESLELRRRWSADRARTGRGSLPARARRLVARPGPALVSRSPATTSFERDRTSLTLARADVQASPR